MAPSVRGWIRVLCLAALLPLGACGFHPLYGSAPDGTAGPTATSLSQISVALIPERTGQLLRQALQERFERNGVPVAHRYDLTVSFGISGDAIALQPDTSNARVRFVGTAVYQLRAQDATRTLLTSGTARSVDGMNVFESQLFAADMETEVVERRIAQAVADDITAQLAVYFDRQAALASR